MTTANTFVLVDPAVEATVVVGKIAGRLASLAGQHLAFIDNSKHNVEPLLSGIERLLRERFGVASVERYRKANPSIPTPPEVLQRLATCDALVHGVGD